MLKRLFDLTTASLALLVLSPVLLWVVRRRKREAAGPVFERCRRAGRGAIPFQMLTFVAPADTGLSRRPASASKLEWLPQLVNVIRGEMSIVGPRPESVHEVERYNWNEKRLLALRPGLIDWASLWNRDEREVLAGAPDPEEAYERVIRPYKLRLELYYLDTHTLWGDVRILLVPVIRTFYKNYVPRDIKSSPSFRELRARVARLVATEQIHRTGATRRGA
ncbi:sugar transferase [Aeoliella sp. SH292]|uniref:sugar transferase n=1 Tax=Aeoliella sp. SH292 TaxID=3454464 RepID=UPI003F9B3572